MTIDFRIPTKEEQKKIDRDVFYSYIHFNLILILPSILALIFYLLFRK